METSDLADILYVVGLVGFIASLLGLLMSKEGAVFALLGMFVSFLVISILMMFLVETEEKQQELAEAEIASIIEEGNNEGK